MRIAIEGCELTRIKLLTYRFFLYYDEFIHVQHFSGGGGGGRDINSGGGVGKPSVSTSVYIPDCCLSFLLLFFYLLDDFALFLQISIL